VSVFDAYSGKTHTRRLQPDDSLSFVAELDESFGWYDLTVSVGSDTTFRRQLAGHVESGRASVTDPAIGGRSAED